MISKNNLFFLLAIICSSLAYAEKEIDGDLAQNLEQRITDLTNQVEQINHKNDLLTKKLESLSTDVEYRFKELEKQASTTASINKKELVKTPPPSKSAKTEFEQAYILIKEQKYSEAEQAFDNFIKYYPNSEYTGVAYYWLGESFLLRKRYDKAAVNYIQSFSKFPKNNKSDLSMLKLASSLNQLKKKKEACEILDKLKAKNSKLSPSIKTLLQKEISKIGCKAKI